MRRLFRNVAKRANASILHRVPKQRLMALFLVLGILAGAVIPTASAYAQVHHRPDSDNPNIEKAENKSKKNKEGRDRPMKQNYPEGLRATIADEKSAADAEAINPKKEFNTPKRNAEEALQGIAKNPKITPRELVDRRTATTSVSINEDGSLTVKQYFAPKHFKKEGKWEKIDTTLVEDKNAADSDNILGRAWGNVRSWASEEKTFKVRDNDWQTRFAPSDTKQGMVRIGKGGDQIGFMPVGAKDGVNPVITTSPDGYQLVNYYDLWPGVDVEYLVESAAVKENIIIKNEDAANQVSFKVLGAELEKKKIEEGLESYDIKGALNDEFAIAPANLILNKFGHVTDRSVFGQAVDDDTITVSVDQDYLQNLPSEAFPVVIDPTTFNSGFGTRAGGDYKSFKSDGYICPAVECNPYAGTLYDSQWNLRAWRSAIFASYDQFKNTNNNLISAKLHLKQRQASFWTGDSHAHKFWAGHATCLNSYNCVNTGALWGSATFASSGDIDLTDFYEDRIAANKWGAWVMLLGDTGSDHSFKNFDPGTGWNTGSYVQFTYGGPPPPPSISSPTVDQVYVDPQASFKVNKVDNPNGSTPLKYQFQVSSDSGASGSLIASNVISSTQWTIPDDILQDGNTYYVRSRSYDPITTTYSAWGGSVPFRIDMRIGADETQTYDTLGPVGVDLATGNVATSVSSHTSAALGGSLGVSLDYNTPLRSRHGLVGQYWDNNSLSGNPVITRVDQEVDFQWAGGSPGSGVSTDQFSARWEGYFVAPETGTYQFGGAFDDRCKIWVDDQLVLDNWDSLCGVLYGTGISLTAGEVVPIKVEFRESTGSATSILRVKGVVDDDGITVPNEWLHTGVRPVTPKKGLRGRYFARLDGTNTFSSSNPEIMERTDQYISFDWGSGAPVANGPTNFLVRWTGYVTVPTSGTYNFGSKADDGTKIIIGPSDTVVYNDWNNGADEGYGSGYYLDANTPTRITIEYYDQGGPANFEFKVQGAVPQQIVPAAWLSTDAQVLPDGWNLGLDPDGNVNYDHLKINQNSAVLMDSTGSTHEYKWNGSGYKPPVNEDGQLVRNADGTFTLQDTDGRTYIFAQDGTLASLTSPVDDRNPAALKYEYQAAPNGGPARIHRIKDGADSSRMATVYYSGETECGSAPTGFDTDAPADMMCAVETNDGRTTYFYYVDGQLARVAAPGNELTDFQYEEVLNASSETIGYRLVGVRDVAANDAIAAEVREDDDEAKTQLDYDILGRATSVTSPAPYAQGDRIEHIIEYLPGSKPYVDENGSTVSGYYGMTKQHVTGASEPNGYTQRIKYDALLRTIESTGITGHSTTVEWNPDKDIAYSATDATGIKSTTVYDDEDRPVSSYGPAPKAWFDSSDISNQVPLTAYEDEVPRKDAAYDEGIVGPAVAWYDYTKLTGNAEGALTDSPKLHTTGINTTNPGTFSYDFSSPPITASGGAQGIGLSASGKLRLPNGTYTISADTSDGIRAWVDDQVVLDEWEDGSHRTVTGNSFTVDDNTPKRIRIDAYRRTSSSGTLNVKIAQSGGFSATTDWSSYLKPGYSLLTSSKVYDSTIGDTESTIDYGETPELGLAESVAADPTGLNLTSSSTHEQQGATGSLLRPTSSSRPGDQSTNPAASYTYYDATETRDNPCTETTESFKQGGLLKLVTNASPDGGTTNGITTETVYDDAGRIVATRTNSDDWMCTTYDSRGRVAETVVPEIGSESGRTVTTDYALWGDPNIVGVEDSEGSVINEVDLLGRTVYYADSLWNETYTGYDALGRLEWRSSDVGEEDFIYDSYHRLTQQKLDNITYAVISYDQYSRVYQVEYPNGGGQKLIIDRDEFGRATERTYYEGGAQTPGTNTIANPSVEQESTNPDVPEGWESDSYGTNTATFTYLNEGYTGNRSVRTDVTAYTDGDAKWIFDPVEVEADTTYTYKDYYKSDVDTELLVQYTHENESVTYEWLGFIDDSDNWAQTEFNFTTPSTATHVSVYHTIAGVGYLIMDDAELYATNQSGGESIMASDEIVLSQSGRVVSGEENGESKSYTYDKVGRLTAATIGSDTYSYGFGTQDGSCANDTNDDSGMNTNRTTQTINSVTTTFCYDYADRLVSSSDPLADDVEYDSHGNITLIGSGSSPLELFYDSSDRNWGFGQYDSNGDGNASYYTRDVQGRINYREAYDVEDWNWNLADEKWYGYTSSGDAPSLIRNDSWDVVEKYLSLPGGVLLTIRPEETGNAQKVYSLPNIHGDVMATTDAAGTLMSTFEYDPFGNQTGTSLPDNTSHGSTFGWVGKHGRITETELALTPIQMGARVYFPTLGRFAQMDPIPGGNANDYVYPADPINSSDISGMWSLSVGVANCNCSLTVTNYHGAGQSNGGGNRIQSPPSATRILQPTINGSRIQNAGGVVVQGRGAVAKARIKAPTKNKSTLPKEKYGFVASALTRTPGHPILGDLSNLPQGGPVIPPPSITPQKSFWSKISYEVTGFVGGAVGGCASGAYALYPAGLHAAGVGCGVGAATWAATGQQIGSFIDLGVESYEYQNSW